MTVHVLKIPHVKGPSGSKQRRLFSFWPNLQAIVEKTLKNDNVNSSSIFAFKCHHFKNTDTSRGKDAENVMAVFCNTHFIQVHVLVKGEKDIKKIVVEIHTHIVMRGCV